MRQIEIERFMDGLKLAAKRSPKFARQLENAKMCRQDRGGSFSPCPSKPTLVLHGNAMCEDCARRELMDG